MMRGKRENFFSREKKFSLSPRAPLSLSRKAGNFFIHLYLPVSGTEPNKKSHGNNQHTLHAGLVRNKTARHQTGVFVTANPRDWMGDEGYECNEISGSSYLN